MALAVACGPVTPSDDPADWEVDTSVSYRLELSEPRFVVPSDRLPAEVKTDQANNNLEIVFHAGRLYLAFRTSETHYASVDTRMYVVSSDDDGETWSFETEIAQGRDVREPRFLSLGEELHLYWFTAGTLPVTFTPEKMWRATRSPDGRWSEPAEVPGGERKVPWDIKVRGGRALMTSYRTECRADAEGSLLNCVHLETTEDGRTFSPVDPATPESYFGGVGETAFEIDDEGALWAVLRNDLGDETGFGSQVCSASPDRLAVWTCPERSSPRKYDSPEMFRHGDDLYLVARRNIGPPYDQELDLPRSEAAIRNQLAYWTKPKRTAIYRIDKETRSVEHLVDLPSAGDTAFASVRRTGRHTFMLANYTSPLDEPDIPWAEAQTSERGTRIYLMEVRLVPQ